MDKNIESKIQIHYYFNDNSHRMNAVMRNQSEKDFLDAILEISNLLEIDNFKLESEAYTQGGVVETLTYSGVLLTIIKMLAPSLNRLIGHYFTFEQAIDEQKLKALKLENKQKELELIEKLIENPKLRRYASNFFKKADDYDKIIAIGFNDKDIDKENIIEKKDFKKFILEDDTDIEIDNNAKIKIIAPILENSRHLWKGYYNDKTIHFSMGDKEFKNAVLSKRYKFSNGNYIKCELHITSKYDNTGELVGKPSYSVKKVFEILDGSGINTVTKKGKEKAMDERQGRLDLYPEDKEK